MNKEDMHARIRRIDKLVAGLGCEAILWRKCSAPVLALDRIAYMDAIHEAIKALETARLILARMASEEGRP